MSKDVKFCEDQKCDSCETIGAFDFMGDFICANCIDGDSCDRYILDVSIYDNKTDKFIENIEYDTNDLDEIASTLKSIIIRKLKE